LKIYLDNCTFNRPFDKQSSIRIRIESEAKLFIQSKIKMGDLELVWSYILDFENNQNPFNERKTAIKRWKQFVTVDIEESESIIKIANSFLNKGIKPKDALHIASAIGGGAEYFITTDDGILKKLVRYNKIVVINPTEFIKILDT